MLLPFPGKKGNEAAAQALLLDQALGKRRWAEEHIDVPTGREFREVAAVAAADAGLRRNPQPQSAMECCEVATFLADCQSTATSTLNPPAAAAMIPRAMSRPVKPKNWARTKNEASKHAIEMAVGIVSRFSCRNMIASPTGSPPNFVWAGAPMNS